MTSIRKNSYTIIAGLILALGLLVSYAVIAEAVSKDDIVFPIAELNGCVDEQECRTYCDNPDNIGACINFAQVHHLISDEEARRAEHFEEIGGVGPSDCRDERSCEAFCNNIQNIEECLDFAQEHNFISREELTEARRVSAALRSGVKLPGECTNKDACEAYCEDIVHIEECLVFGEATGLMSPDELQGARRFAEAMRSGHRPPGDCRGHEECEAYCSAIENLDECLAFAEASGFIPREELEEIRRIAPLMARGEMPGGCTNRAECEVYCQDEAHFDECSEFAVKAGLMSREDAERFRETGGVGPGGCRGREECETFCNEPANQEACFEFGRKHGLISEEELTNIREGINQLRGVFETAPPEVVDCLRAHLGTQVIDEIRAGTLTPGPEVGERVRLCFEEFMPRPEESFLPRGDDSPEEFRGDSIEDLQRLRELRRLEDLQREEELFREQDREDTFQNRFFEDLIEPLIPDVNKEDFSTRESFDRVQENYFIEPEFGGVTCESLRYARSIEFVPSEYHEKFKACFPRRL